MSRTSLLGAGTKDGSKQSDCRKRTCKEAEIRKFKASGQFARGYVEVQSLGKQFRAMGGERVQTRLGN
jgi:hypothetical protein